MDTEHKEVRIVPPELMVKAGAIMLGTLALFLLAQTISTFKSLQFIGSGVTATNTISVNGDGEVFAIPDTAEFSVTVQETAKEVADAQKTATTKANDIVAFLKQQGIEEKNIKTTDYSVNPQYEWQGKGCPPGQYCPNGKQVLTGFQVTQTISIKTKDTKKAGELLSGVGSRGAAQVSGLSFTVENEDTLKADARSKAIENARAKAEQLASSLGVNIVRVVGFSENGGNPPPMYYAKTMSAGVAMDSQAAPAPEISVGQNKINANVSVTYEIR